MTDQQLQQPAARELLNAMTANAALAYNEQESGVQWVYLRIQQLATMDITAV
jgi:hypothetical protein